MHGASSAKGRARVPTTVIKNTEKIKFCQDLLDYSMKQQKGVIVIE
jgi:hypothetical protein